jgi:hypothetical protein
MVCGSEEIKKTIEDYLEIEVCFDKNFKSYLQCSKRDVCRKEKPPQMACSH